MTNQIRNPNEEMTKQGAVSQPDRQFDLERVEPDFRQNIPRL